MSVENPTAAEIRLNHERAEKAVAALNKKAWSGIRYFAILQEGKPARIRQESRPANYGGPVEYTHDYTVDTRIEDRQGVPVTYANEHTGNHIGTMTYRVYTRGRTIANKREGLRMMQNKADSLRKELAAMEEAVATREADIARLTAE